MFDRSKCNLCGDCLLKCQYVDYDRDRAIREFTALTEGKEAPILKECITCLACNEYCPTEANPYDLIMRLQEETGAVVIPEKMRAFLDGGVEVPNEVINGDHDKPVLSVCIAGPLLSEAVLGSKMFEGLTIVKGGDYWCYVVYLHAALESVVEANVPKFFDNLAKLGAREIIFLHDECYAMVNRIAADYGLKPSFKPIHIVEYVLNYLKEHKGSITKLNRKIAYQRSCSGRWTPELDAWIDELFDLIGVERVARKHDRGDALCCTFSFGRLKPELASKVQDMNLTDAQEHGAEAMVFICPWCQLALRKGCQERGLPQIYLIDLCRMALGEKPLPC